VLLGHGPHHFLTGRVAELDQRIGQVGVRVFGDLSGLVELVLTDDATAEEDFGEIPFFLGWSRCSHDAKLP
jgi:hypothetical protein